MELDYVKIGLKSGLEIHQQLDTGKLFSRSPSILREDKPDHVLKRWIRVSSGEKGEIDKAAKEAFEKGLYYEYQSFYDTVSLIEEDEEPPQPVDKKAFETILKIALMCNSNIVDEVLTMRKVVVDGSNTSGFQRTALVSLGGTIELKNKKIGVQTIVLEEDSARPVEKNDKKIVYSLDRLGIPLIELATDPDLKTPEEVKECALKIGELMRRTCNAKRGLGTIRQDLNISIREGARIELKGVQELNLIDEYVKREALRQINLIKIKEELLKKGVKEGFFSSNSKNLNSVFLQTESKVLRTALDLKQTILGLKLENFSGILGKEVQPNKRFATELSHYVKAKTKLKGLFHSDELPKYGVSEEEVNLTKKELECSNSDAFIIVSGQEKECVKALNVIIERCNTALKGVPEETRNALPDGNSTYSRPLPGAARMYPETDLQSIKISEKMLTDLKQKLPLTLEQRLKLYKSKGLGEKLAQEMKLNNFACFFETLLEKEFNATTVASFLLETLKALEREKTNLTGLTNEKILKLFETEKSGKITKEIFAQIVKKWSKDWNNSLENVISELGFEKGTSEELEKTIKQIVTKNIKLVKSRGLGSQGPLMGDVMKQLKGKYSGKEISETLKKEILKVIK